MVFLSIRAFFNRKIALFKFEAVLVMLIWAMAMLFAATRGIRFVVFLLVPLGFFLVGGLMRFLELSRKKKNIYGMIAAGILFFSFSIILVNKANVTGQEYLSIDE